MNLKDSFAQLGLWVFILSSQLNVHKMTPRRNFLCISNLLLKCSPRIFVAGLLRPDGWKFFGVWSTENQGPWRQGNLRINRFLPEYSPERIMRIDWLEIVQRIRTPLSSRHGSRYGTPGHPSGGRTDGFPVIWCPNYSSLPTSTNVG